VSSICASRPEATIETSHRGMASRTTNPPEGDHISPSPARPMVLWALAVLVFVAISIEAASAADKVSLRLRWDHQFQFAGFYAADWEGYYADAGLDVEIKSVFGENGKILDVIEEVAQGRDDFGIGSADILVGIHKGHPLKILATVFQQNPVEFYVRKDAGFRSLADFTQMRVVRRRNDLIDVELQTMLRLEGINPELVEPLPPEKSFDQFASGAVDVIGGHQIVTPFILGARGVEFITVKPATYGVDFYGDSLFTRQEMIDRHPDVVKRFIGASIKGWYHALEYPEGIADRIARDFRRVFTVEDPVAFNHFQIDGVRKASLYPVVEVGHINPGRWLRMDESLRELGLVTGKVDERKLFFDPARIDQERAKLVQKAAVLLAVIVISVIAWNLTMRRTVAARTRQLVDLTEEHRKTQAQLLRKERLAAIGQLTAIVSHELRNPLGSMRNSVAVIRTLVGDEASPLKRPVDIIQRNVTRCDNIVSDLLNFGRTTHLKLQPTEVDEWLEDLLKEYRIPDGIELRRRLGSEATVNLDRDRIHRAVVNLLDNACDATKSIETADTTDRTPSIIVSSRVEDGRLTVSVEDAGPGIPSDCREDVFEPLYSTKNFGIGLGLPIVRQIAERHEGGVEINTKPGVGTQVVFWLPIEQPSAGLRRTSTKAL